MNLLLRRKLKDEIVKVRPLLDTKALEVLDYLLSHECEVRVTITFAEGFVVFGFKETVQ